MGHSSPLHIPDVHCRDGQREGIHEGDGVSDCGGGLTSQELNFLRHSRLMRELEIWAASQDVPLVDVISALDGDRDVLVSWVHLSPRGNQMVAAAFAQEILAGRLARPTILPRE